jgi:hypothetical protein
MSDVPPTAIGTIEAACTAAGAEVVDRENEPHYDFAAAFDEVPDFETYLPDSNELPPGWRICGTRPGQHTSHCVLLFEYEG